jgi:hypothetical protein
MCRGKVLEALASIRRGDADAAVELLASLVE